MLMAECDEILGIEVIGGPLALEGRWFLPARGEYKVHLVPALVAPLEHFPVLGTGHDFDQYGMLP
jgi:hypothetical protein